MTVLSNSTGRTWVSDPDPSYRSTYNILSLCITTLVICVWSAIHLDIPTYRQSATPSLLRSVRWKLGALIVPELFLIAAFMQFLSARGLRLEAQTYLPAIGDLAGGGTTENDIERMVGSNSLLVSVFVDSRHPTAITFTSEHRQLQVVAQQERFRSSPTTPRIHTYPWVLCGNGRLCIRLDER